MEFQRTSLRPCVLVAFAFSWVPADAFEFNVESSCVLLNSNNTDIISVPDDCVLPTVPLWCNCTRTVLTNPRPGGSSGIEQGVIWVRGDPGIGNHRVEVRGGTLDVSGIASGNVIGGTLINELVPESVGVPPGTIFKVRGEIRATARNGDEVEFDVVVVEVSTIVGLILRYNPLDAAHSKGLLYRGKLTTNGPGGGFVFEFRYEGLAGTSPAIEPGDADAPGFNVRNAISLFTRIPEVFTLPEQDFLDVHSTLRKFTSAGGQVSNPDEVLPLGDPEPCKVVVEPEPCREFDELLDLVGPQGNHHPQAEVVLTDPFLLQPLPTPEVFIDCGEGRVLLRGSNSTDGDGGTQGLQYKWEVVDGPENGASIPPVSVTFMDSEISFLIPGQYTIRLTVDDGQAENNIDFMEVVITADAGIEPNLPPEVSVRSEPDPAEVVLAGGTAQVKLIASASTGPDGCMQTISYDWQKVSGPDTPSFDTTFQDDTTITFTGAGEYVIRVTVDDGAPEDHLASAEITVKVLHGDNGFQRCDVNGDGLNDISDAVYVLAYQFLGGAPPRCEASADCNSDGTTDVSDPVYNLGFLFLGQEPPAPPYPGCDFAGSGCETSTPCTP